ncbi:universal stress protein [Caenimonas terrae]|uniref:Universal stress protein n=1 Tax=Caenimonas terrae TaxID=696074 RepID=A0ABW0NFG0_9BURK
MFRRILVAIDGSPTSDRALEEAIRLAQTVTARLRLVHVMDELAWVNGFESSHAYFDDVLPRMREAGEKLLAAGLAKALAAGVAVESELVLGGAGRVCEQIAEEARRWPADLIVAGTHGRRGVDRALLGSDAEQIARYAPVPVLLVRAPNGTASRTQ